MAAVAAHYGKAERMMKRRAVEMVAEERTADYWDTGDACLVIQTRVAAEGIAVAERGSLVVVAAVGTGLVDDCTAAEKERHSVEERRRAVVDSLEGQQNYLGSVLVEDSVLHIPHHLA